ncbi:hypothetical protein ACFWWT_49315 [Streptomyces sp. NPDC058676]|uniref:hypothetical protein n=1 Tax=unclassified Streptomyces TaxID=2593676 RepID=UPI0036602643
MNGHDQVGRSERLVAEVKAGPGGAMTSEVGIVTGDLTVATTLQPDGQATVAVQYTGAEEWYTLVGSPTRLPPHGLKELHETALAGIQTGGGARTPRITE